MYVTRPLSLYKRHPELLSEAPEGPGSGFLVLTDAEDVEYKTSCFCCEIREPLKDFPFPQNGLLTLVFNWGEDTTIINKVACIPVVDQPLSSNLYYVIAANDDDEKGLAYICANKEEGIPFTACFCLRRIKIPDKTPKDLNPYDIHQQFEFHKIRAKSRLFYARSVDPDCFPPEFLRFGQEVHAYYPKTLGEANGINSDLRSQLPDFDFPASNEHSLTVSVGKWYCPFMFFREGTPKERMEIRNMFYELTLEQRWQRIFTCENGDVGGETVALSVAVPTETVRIAQTVELRRQRNIVEAVPEMDEAGGMMWFWAINEMGLKQKIGVSLVIIQRMMWEQERVGWARGNEQQVTVDRVEKYQGEGSWKKFGCYMLVEQFVLKRQNGSIVLTYDFNHTNQIRSKWE